MRRRDFIGLLGGAAAIWPAFASAQSVRRRIAIFSITSAEYDAANLAAFREGLRQLGHIEGRTVDIDYRASNGETKNLPELAQELLGLKPQVVLATAVTPTRVMNGIAPRMPIVCPGFSDSFVPSLATSFARPGGSVTGVASDVETLIGKLAELASDAIPNMTKIGFLSNPAGGSMARFEQQVRSAAKARGIEVRTAHAEKLDDIPGALQQFRDDNVQAVVVPTNGLLNSAQKQIVELAMALRLPLIFGTREGAMSGGLASYGVNTRENYRRAAAYVDKILKGAAPGDLPIEFPTKIDLIVNLKTAKTLGLTVPAILLDRANEVIE
jgi:putative ABC transport system substrate-binding protein